MDLQPQIIAAIILAIIAISILLLIRFRYRSWFRFGVWFIPFVFLGTIIVNLILFPVIDQADRWQFQRLPSNDLIDLYQVSMTPYKIEWIYPLVEIYYQGRTLYTPDGLLETLDLSQELLQTQGYLADVIPLQMDRKLTESELDLILDWEDAQILMIDGNEYHFVSDGMDQDSSLLLLQSGNQVFFVPEGILSDWERGS